MKYLFKNRFSLLFAFIFTYIILSLLTRMALLVWSHSQLSFNLWHFIKIFGYGFMFDLGVAVFFVLLYGLYLLLLPSKLIGSYFDRFFTYFIMGLVILLSIFGLIGEFPFWEEFNNRYNFIAVDYLIYTYEVVQNINQSYPIPLIILLLLSIIGVLFFLYHKKGILRETFQQKPHFLRRMFYFLPLLAIALFYVFFIKNSQAEWSENTYHNELSKNGVYSLFAAYISNELDFNRFYQTLPESEVYTLIKKELLQNNQQYLGANQNDLLRQVSNDSVLTPNIILITVESLSAEYMSKFGNQQQLTPNLDSLSQNSTVFTKMYATGTRTVRGMEALTLSVPPTPGHSIVRRPNNEKLFSIASVLRQQGYSLEFIYGGDGYFDNMNYFFGSQGFDIIDRDRGNPLSDNITTKRYPIADEEVTFENAWGICDEDIYNQSIRRADLKYQSQQPFFQFIMTTSNHRPYTFPDKTIDLPQGTRESAIKYTDYSIGNFIEKAKSKPWFKNTVFVIVADHCASSAGRWEINIDKYHIPALIYNLPQKVEINKLVSQIDLMPTLFGMLHWNYKTELYGKDALLMQQNDERALIGNYRTVGLLKNGIFTQLNDRKSFKQFNWTNVNENNLKEISGQPNDSLLKLTIAYYQSASQRFKNGQMKE